MKASLSREILEAAESAALEMLNGSTLDSIQAFSIELQLNFLMAPREKMEVWCLRGLVHPQ